RGGRRRSARPRDGRERSQQQARLPRGPRTRAEGARRPGRRPGEALERAPAAGARGRPDRASRRPPGGMSAGRWIRARVQDERGFTLVELLVVMILLAIILGPLVDSFASGTRAAYVTNSNLNAQQDLQVALSRLEYEGRCGSSATLLSGGAGVTF